MKPSTLHALAVVLVACLSAGDLRAQLRLVPIHSLDLCRLTQEGSEPSIGAGLACIAWNGKSLLCGGESRGPKTSRVGLVEVAQPLTQPAFSHFFGAIPTKGPAGYSQVAFGLDHCVASFATRDKEDQRLLAFRRDGTLAFSHPTEEPWAFALHEGNRLTQAPQIAAVPLGTSMLAALDPRDGRALPLGSFDLSGQDGPAVRFVRDLEFVGDSGLVAARLCNQLLICDLKAPKARAQSLGHPPFATIPRQQCVTAIPQSPFGPVLLWNDRHMSIPGQALRTVIQAHTLTNRKVVIDWGAFLWQAGHGGYDLAFDPTTQTLALADLSCAIVHFFRVEWVPAGPL